MSEIARRDRNPLASVIERDIPQLITHARRLLAAFGPPPGN